MHGFKWKIGIGGIVFAAVVLALLLYPWETTIVPEWKLQVRDESAKPVPGVLVSEWWGDSSIESAQHCEDQLSDSNGYLSFPARTVSASLLERFIKKAINLMKPHGGPGQRTAYLLVLGPYKPATDEPYYVAGRQLATQIVVHSPGQSAP